MIKKHFVAIGIMVLMLSGCTPPPATPAEIPPSISTEDAEKEIAKNSLPAPDIHERRSIGPTMDIYTVTVYKREGYASEIHVVDKESGFDTIEFIDENKALFLYAIPKKENVNEIYLLSKLPESDNPNADVYALPLDTGKKELKVLPFTYDLPFNFNDATSLSPDESKMAAAYDGFTPKKHSYEKQLVIYDLVNARVKTFPKLRDGEYLSQFNGENAFAGTEGYHITWLDHQCVSVKIYRDDPEKVKNGEDLTEKIFKETRKYCL